MGFVNLFPAPLAGLFEKKLSALTVVRVGPIVQATLAVIISCAQTFPIFAAAGLFFVSVMIFTHTFAFGLLSSLDPTGRAVAATPAMLMVGAAIGPILGGVLVQNLGYPAIGGAAVLFALLAVILFSQARRGQAIVAITEP